MKESSSPLPDFYKGIVLFTPGGDIIYTIDPNKQERWHLHLCLGLQEILGLPEPHREAFRNFESFDTNKCAN